MFYESRDCFVSPLYILKTSKFILITIHPESFSRIFNIFIKEGIEVTQLKLSLFKIYSKKSLDISSIFTEKEKYISDCIPCNTHISETQPLDFLDNGDTFLSYRLNRSGYGQIFTYFVYLSPLQSMNLWMKLQYNNYIAVIYLSIP